MKMVTPPLSTVSPRRANGQSCAPLPCLGERTVARHTVAAVVLDGVHPFELGVACEVFGLERPELGVPWYRFLVCAAEPPPLRTGAGFLLDTSHGLADLAEADTLVFTHWRSPEEPVPPALIEAVRAAHRRGARLVTICSGVFVLAAAGLLDGRPATSHWRYTDALSRLYPTIDVRQDVLYVDDGEILTSAGTAAGIDLCLHLVRLDYGAEIANAVARRMVVAAHRDGGQAQFVERPVAPEAGDDPLGRAVAWALGNLDQPISVEQLASHACMSPRTFARQFRATYGTTPYRWLLQQRLLLARRLLETTGQPIDLVAEQSGFGTATALRLHFKRSVSISPLAYRRLFASG
jgi:AraC family transcriptional regulator, transcriptional activator FtrA